MKTLFSQSSINRFPPFLLSIAILLTGAIFIWFISYFAGYDDMQSFAAHQHSGWVMAIAVTFAVVIMTAWLAVIRIFYKSRKTLLSKNAEMQRTEEVLQQSEARFRDLIENAGDLIYTGDLQGNFTSLNKVGEIITGYSQAEFCQMNFAGIVAPEHLENANRKFAHKVTSGLPTAYELEIITKSGQRVALDLNNRIVLQAGKPIGVQGIGRDITDRKLGEKTLCESEARYRVVTESASDAILTIDRESTILFVNSAAEKIFGYTVDEMLGNKLSMLMPESMRGAHAAGMKRYQETNKRNISWQGVELPGLHKDGSEVPLEITFGEITSDGKHLFTAVIRDITERKRAEDKLRESKEWLQAIFDASRDGIIIEDGAEIAYINKSYTQLLGYDEPEELIGRQISELLSPEDAERMMEFGRRRLRGEPTPSVYEFKSKRKDGTLVETEGAVSTAVIGGKKYIMTASRDITERRRAKEELQKNLSLLTSTFETTAEGILVVDRNNKIVTYNRHFVDMAQIPDEVIKSADNAKVINFVLDQLTDPEAFIEKTKQLVLQPETHSYDIVKFKDGRIFERYSHPQTLDGKVVGRVVSFRDITGRKRAEEEVRQSEEKHRTILETIEEGYYEIDLAGNFTFFNDALVAYLRYGKDEMKGLNYRQYVDEETAAVLFRAYNKVFTTGQPVRRLEYEVIRKDGTRMFGESSVSLIRNAANEPVGFRGVVRDITERKQAEATLRESESLLAAAQRITHLGSWELVLTDLEDLNNNEVRWSDETYHIFGFEPGQIKVSNEIFYNAVHPDDRTRISEVLIEAIEQRKIYNIEHRIILPDGGERIVHGQAELIFDKQTGKPIKLLGTVQDITERKRAEELIRHSEEKYRNILETIEEGYFETDLEGVFTFYNEALGDVLGYDTDELLGMHYRHYVDHRNAKKLFVSYVKVYRTGQPLSELSWEVIRKDGTRRFLESSITLIRNAAGIAVGFRGLVRDITRRKQTEEALRESENKFRMLVENTSEGLLQVDSDDRTQFINDRLCEMVGYSADELINKNWTQILLDDKGRDLIGQANERRRKGISDRYEIKLRKKSGELFWVIIGGAPMVDAEGVIIGSLGVFSDISERKRAEAQLLHDAFHDGLTGLANRALFMDHLRMTIERGKSRHSNPYAVLFLDFDRFKVINDSLGHAEGDNLLKHIGRRLESATRTGDLVARLGGDEFVILLSEMPEEGNAVQVAERIHNNLKSPFDLNGSEVFVSASIGIALSTAGHKRPEDMVRDADIAMYRAKAKGRAQYQVFDQAMHEYASKQLSLDTEMRRALERREFLIHYQPIITLENDSLVGFEALVRWRHPERGMIPPFEFIPAAEENGLILPLGNWILRESCRQLRRWQKENPSASRLKVSVNLSTKQFSQSDLAEQIAAALNATGLDPHCLKLEITESHIMENSEQAIIMMNRLRALGVELSLDDFGTGYSSLSYLHRLPVSYLKIDRSFVMRMTENEENGEIVSTIIKLAQNLKMKVIAEGIETAEQLAHLKVLGCEYGQGYFFSKPLEAEAAEKFIEDNGETSLHLLNQTIINAELNM